MKKPALLFLPIYLALFASSGMAQSTSFTSKSGYTFDASAGAPREYQFDTQDGQPITEGYTDAPSAPAGGVTIFLPNDPLNPGNQLLLQYGTLTGFSYTADAGNPPIYPGTTGAGYTYTYSVDAGQDYDANSNPYEASFSGKVHFTFTGTWKWDTCGGRGLKHCPVYREDEGYWSLQDVPLQPPADPTPASGCASRDDSRQDVTFGLPSESDLVIDKVPNCSGEDYRKQPCWRGKI